MWPEETGLTAEVVALRWTCKTCLERLYLTPSSLWLERAFWSAWDCLEMEERSRSLSRLMDAGDVSGSVTLMTSWPGWEAIVRGSTREELLRLLRSRGAVTERVSPPSAARRPAKG